MTTARKFHTVLLATLLLTAAVHASGPQPADIPADAKAYIHLDTALLRDSDFLKTFRDEIPSNPLDKAVETIDMAVGLNLLADLDGITFYTPTLKEGQAVVLFYGKIKQNDLQQHVENFPEYASQSYGDHTIHTWFDHDRNSVVAAMISEKLVIWADNADRMKTALDVIDGKKEAKYAPTLDYPKNALFAAALTDTTPFAKKPDSQILALAKSFQISLSENKGALTAIITAGMPDAQQSNQLQQVADGIKAFVALNKAKMPELAKLIAQIKTDSDASHTRITIERPVATAFADLKLIKSATEGHPK